ncbi:MAG: InlB B-repeat-containing protein [Clostridiales bacterium]|nr:InlB B-repeat-containing protein [Clostridiales bacterium]
MSRLRKKYISFAVMLIISILSAALCLTACGGIDAPSDNDNNHNNNNGGGDEYCIVVFYENQGTPVAPQNIKVGDYVVRPPDPTRSGYTFGGWYKDTNFNNEWVFNVDTAYGETLTLYAKWTPVGGGEPDPIPEYCKVTFVTNCSATVNPQNILVGGKVIEPVISNSGYNLDGWYNGSKKWNFATDTVSGSTLVLTAKWTAINTDDPITGEDVTVTFNVGLEARKAGVYNPAPITKKAGSRISEPVLTRNGYEMSGWYVEDSNTKWNFATDKITENMTLFARWTADDAAIDYTPTMTNNNTLYIHYLRSNNDYTGWCAWVWKDGSNGKRKTSMTVDAAGAVFAIDLSEYGNASALKFIIAIISADNKFGEKDGDNNDLTLSDAQKVGNSYHWYVRQGSTANGTNKPMAANSGGSNRTTEAKRASESNVNRNYAKNLPVMSTVDGWDEMGVGYQIFVASFCDSNGDGVGDLNGITSKLDYLQRLNVDVLWLTPIQSSNSYHGYDCYDYYCIDPKFGTNADYRRLVSEAHKRGMKIIMDLVVNHTSPQNEWFQKSKDGVIEEVTYQDGSTATVKYRDFYRWKNSGGNRYESAGDGWYFYSSFGGNMPELNYDYQPVRDAMVDVASYWMSYGLDGFRMDAIKHVFMWEESVNANSDKKGGVGDTGYEYNETKNIEFFKEFNYKLKTKYPHCFLLGEQLNGNTDDVSPFYQGMDSLFDFNTYYDLPQRIDGNKGGVSSQATAFNSNAQKYLNQRKDRPINGMISSNHDINRLYHQVGGNAEKIKLYMAVIMTMPGLSWIYYGDEIGLIGDKSTGGDNGLRQSMKWTDNWANKCTAIQDYQRNNNTDSVQKQESNNNSVLSYIKSLTKFRNDNPALISGTATCSADNGMLKITVTGGGKTYTVYHNFSSGRKSITGNVVFGSSNIPAYGTSIIKN